MRLTFFYSFIYFYVFHLSTVTSAGHSQGGILTDDIDRFINQVLAEWGSPGGVSVAAVRKDRQGEWSVETKGYGVATINGTKVTERTLFNIGSNSKLFTVFAAGLLVSNETLVPRLTWTTKIASILPIWGLSDPVASRDATLVDVMSHRTGLPRHDLHYKWTDDVPAVIKKMKYLRPSAEFRDIWQYDNSMYMLLSHLPSALLPSSIPFAHYVKQNILDPLEMNSTTYFFDEANASGQLADGLARQGVNKTGDPFGKGTTRALPYWAPTAGNKGDVLSGAGGVISNAVDMATWLQTLLLNGVNPRTNDSVIPASVVETAATGVTVITAGATFPELSPRVYGGGQMRNSYRGHELIEHGGDTLGFHSQISRLPFDNVGIAVLTNDEMYGPLITAVIRARLLDEALGLEAVDWNSRYKALATTPTPLITPKPDNASYPTVEFSSLAGQYQNDGYGAFELCLVAPLDPFASTSCKILSSNASVILPGIIDPNVPTFLAEWNSPWASFLKVAHFDGNYFNISAIKSYPTGNSSEPYWVSETLTADDKISYAEISVDEGRIGIGMVGIWGAGEGVPSPQGSNARERSEVWFDQLSSRSAFRVQ